jgi:hypothetical protein
MIKFSLFSLVYSLLALNCVAQTGPPVTATVTLEAGAKDRDLQTVLYFEGISYEKLLVNSPALVGKNYQIIINEFVKGSLTKTDVVFDSSEDEYFRLKANKLGFAVVSKVTEGNEFKILFQFNGFSAGRKYRVDSHQKDKFTLKSFFYKEAPISLNPNTKTYLLAFMTPYVRADKSEAYCEVAQSGIDPEHLYERYQIPHYFLVAIQFN